MYAGILTWLLAGQPAAAHNNLFLPGDAFFPAEAAPLLTDTRPVTLEYASLSRGAMGCGYAGFQQLRVTGLSATERSALTTAIERAVAHAAAKEPGYTAESVVVLGYARAQSLEGLVFGQRYNETLPEDEARSGHSELAPPLEGAALQAAQAVGTLPLVDPTLSYAGLMGAEVPQEVPASKMQWVVADRYTLWQQGTAPLTLWLVRGGTITELHP